VLLAWLKISASYRTDTTKTVLSAPEGKSGRHSGSGLSTEVQGPAHGQLRDIVMVVLLELETAEGGTELSMRILLVAVAAASQAQLNLANFVKRGMGSVSDTSAISTREQDGNAIKKIVSAYFKSISPAEKRLTTRYTQSFVDSTQKGGTGIGRSLIENFPVAPPRSPLSGDCMGDESKFSLGLTPLAWGNAIGVHVTWRMRDPDPMPPLAI
jgi:hypothetical protein